MNKELIFILSCIRESMCDYTEDEYENDTSQYTKTDDLCLEVMLHKCSSFPKEEKNCNACLLTYKNNIGYSSQITIVIQKLI
ncbi:hypothetical protein CPT_Pollock9 [Escherichia phage Pollock]|uniref:Uncharacterized protein n=1 Tax=Escherichia phage Pollock TaxID=1540097 RepID=A0A0A0YU31_9CAUD|nr:hypothetical protein ACQ44_gp09 [Escherichia phage Pollock]AIX12368.1 hypothetical protein CPT_Pollock9 [Escherichia phage Pollock]